MKEQINVDDLKILEELRTKDATDNTIWRAYSQSTNIVVSRKEHESLKAEVNNLKRLQDNVNKLISEKKNLFAKLNSENLFHAFTKHEIELLENLDK